MLKFTGSYENTSLADARQWLRDNLEPGADCPCCTRLAKVYKRSLSAGKALALIRIYRLTRKLNPPNGWLHVPNELLSAGYNAMSLEYSKLQHWKLLEPWNDSEIGGGKDPSKMGAGFWRITELGRRFVRGEATVPKYIKVYDQRCLGYEGERIDIRHALGTKFDYEELMS